jgi:DNA-binding transcriptional ArsR family regulator
MSLRNPFDDIEVTEPRVMKALSHPVRLGILERLQRHGPATATQLSEHVPASPSVVSWHLRHLAEFGLVEDAEDPQGDRRRRWWKSVARGFRFEFPEDAEGAAASRMLYDRVLTQALSEVQRWASEDEPGLDDVWRRSATVANTGVRLSPAELHRLETEVEALIAPYVTRPPEDVPHDARSVRILRITMPAVQTGPAGTDESRPRR